MIDQGGRLVAQWTASTRELGALPVMSAGLASPGSYRLRVAAIDTTGRRGSADYALTTKTVTSGALAFSAMVLGVSYERSVVPKMQYVSEPTANGTFDVFGPAPAGTLSVALELAASEDGTAIVRVPGTNVPTKDAERRRATGVVPISQLPPGDYVLRAVVSLDRHPIATLARTLRKSAP